MDFSPLASFVGTMLLIFTSLVLLIGIGIGAALNHWMF